MLTKPAKLLKRHKKNLKRWRQTYIIFECDNFTMIMHQFHHSSESTLSCGRRIDTINVHLMVCNEIRSVFYYTHTDVILVRISTGFTSSIFSRFSTPFVAVNSSLYKNSTLIFFVVVVGALFVHVNLARNAWWRKKALRENKKKKWWSAIHFKQKWLTAYNLPPLGLSHSFSLDESAYQLQAQTTCFLTVLYSGKFSNLIHVRLREHSRPRELNEWNRIFYMMKCRSSLRICARGKE